MGGENQVKRVPEGLFFGHDPWLLQSDEAARLA